jgi:uncharacterized protein YecT (DUF1311 family)
MKDFPRLSLALVIAVSAGVAACRKETKGKEVATVAQDTMLLHDLAEANKNTAAAAAADNSLTTVMTSGSAPTTTTSDAGPGQTPQNRTSDSRTVTATAPGIPSPWTSGPRLTPPRTANDAPAPTNVPLSRSPANARPSSGDLCDSPTPADQRACLNRSIVANDADLNSTYQELIAQARKSGGPDLEERIRQSQREWVNERDVNCRPGTQSAGTLWARSVARCLAGYSDKRTAELRRTLSGLRGQ